MKIQCIQCFKKIEAFDSQSPIILRIENSNDNRGPCIEAIMVCPHCELRTTAFLQLRELQIIGLKGLKGLKG